MSDKKSRDDIRDALLAQDTPIGESRYANYRRALDQRIDEALARRTTRLKVRWLRIGLAAAAVAAITVFVWRPWSAELGKSRDKLPLIVLRSPADRPRPWAPFELETKADLIVTVTTGEAMAAAGQSEHGEELIPLRFERVLKGTPPDAWLATKAPESPGFACVAPPPNPVPVPKDSHYLLYLARKDDSGWNLLAMRTVNDAFNEREMRDIERCVALTEAAKSKKPEVEYKKLLCPPSGQFDNVASCTLGCAPDPRAADALLDNLAEIHRRLVKDGRSAQGGKDGDIASLARLAQVLARTREARAAVPIVECARLLPAGHRGPCYRHVPNLAHDSGEKDRRRVADLLFQEIDDVQADPNDASSAAEALGKLADAWTVEELIKREGRQPVSAPSIRANRALESIFEYADAERRAHLIAAWIDLLRARPQSSAPPQDELTLIRSVIRMLVRQTLSPQQYDVLRGIRSRHAGNWLGRELDPLVK